MPSSSRFRLGCSASLALLLSACSPHAEGPGRFEPLPPPPPASSLSNDWLDGSRQLSPERFDRLLSIAGSDATVRQLVDTSVQTFGLPGPRGLAEIVSVCAPEVADESGGRTTSEFNVHVFSLDAASLVSGKHSPAVEAHLREIATAPGVVTAKVEEGPDYVVVRRWLRPKICIAAGIDLATAFDTLTHELTHALRRDPHAAPRLPSEYPSERAYLEERVQLPGDEVDAYLAGVQARLRLTRSTRGIFPQLAQALGPTGEPQVSRAELARIVLDAPPSGLGYAQTALRDAYAQALNDERGEAASRLSVVDDALAQRKAYVEAATHNLGAYEHNVGAYRRNAEIARGRGDGQAAAKLVAQSEQAERDLARTRAELAAVSASITRLEPERPRLAAWVDRVEQKQRALPR